MRFGRPLLLSHLVSDAAERDPAGVAVVGTDERLDYETLADRVARLSAALGSLGVRPHDRVVIFASKSVNALVAMHAAMHVGAIAVPVDPRSPVPTLEALARELTPRVVVVESATAARWPDPTVATIGESADPAGKHMTWTDVNGFDGQSPVNRLGSDPAYIISTSGSTGRPKSIVHTHTSGLRYAELAAACYDLRADDRMANVAPFHFDQSTFELYSAPLVGASSVLIPDVLLRFPASVSEVLERESVTTWYSVPTILRQLHERGALDRRDLSALRWVLFGGEIFPPTELHKLMAVLPHARFSNVYGPAEVNQCMFHHLEGEPPDARSIPIGTAWPGTELRIVNPDATVVDGAGRGELHVRTDTAMAGYWGRPDLDEAAFHTESTEGGLAQRWYRTGDVVERDSDGTIVFVGRIDRQVKIRGVRVELEAVEAALDAIDGVNASAAICTGDPDSPLVGLVETATIDDPDSVFRALRDRLPPGAIPDRIVLVSSLPVTTSGKIDSVKAAQLLEIGAGS